VFLSEEKSFFDEPVDQRVLAEMREGHRNYGVKLFTVSGF
jgi:hypothetical protein